MTGKIVNLRQARKKLRRDEDAKAADSNAALHGLTKDRKSLAEARAEKERRDLDGLKRE